MTKKSEESRKDGNAINPKHFIYLDRNRLFSYISQIADGLPKVRNFLETVGDSTISQQPEYYSETTTEEKSNLEGSAGPKSIVGNLSAQKSGSRTRKRGHKNSKPTKIYDYLNILSENKIEHDNLYLALESDLEEAGHLITIEGKENKIKYSGLTKITASSRFFDWDSILNLFSDPENIFGIAGDVLRVEGKTEAESINYYKHLSSILKEYSIGELILHSKKENLNILCPLNSENLYLTRGQIRSCYMIYGAVELTIVGFISKRVKEEIKLSGSLGSIDLSSAMKNIVGETDIIIEPLAIYN